MKGFFDKLTPAERRLVVIVGIAVFGVINIWFVFPMFGQYGEFQEKRKETLKKIETFKAENAKKSTYDRQINELLRLTGDVPTDTAALRLFDEVSSQATLSGIGVSGISPLNRAPSGGKTNAFFEEASVNVNFAAGEKELIDFLYRLADKQFLIRAKSMTVQPEPPGRMRLAGTVTLVKSYQRKPPPKAAPTTPKTAPATNTATRPAPKTPPAPRTAPGTTNAPAGPLKK